MQFINQFSGLLMILISATLLVFSFINARKNLSRRWPLPAAALILAAGVTFFFIRNRTGPEHISAEELEQLLRQPSETPVLLELYSEY